MASIPEPERVQRAILAALARNRGELDAAKLERLLRLLGTPSRAA
ncbi:MAG: hypothetical protein ACRDNE_02805 [Gaiellaceae bacterium]